MNVKSPGARVACLLALIASSASFGAIKNNYIAPEARSVEGGRDVQVVVAQAEIRPNINVSNVTAATGGGLLFALIDAGINNSRAKEAEKTVVPLREALVGYEFDQHAQTASAATLSSLGWFDPKQAQVAKDDSQVGLLAAIDAANTPQIMLLRYSYETNAEFTSLIVNLNASLVNKKIPQGKKSDARLAPKNLAYNQSFRSMITLPGSNSKDPAANVQAWSADNGKLARAALDLGVERCQLLLKRGLEMTAADATSIQKRNKRQLSPVAGVPGWVLESDGSHTLIYEGLMGTLTQVEPAATGAPAAATTPAAPAVAAQ